MRSDRYISELNAWQQALKECQENLADIKNRLAQAVVTCKDAGFLEKAEDFQSICLNKDIVILFIRKDIRTQINRIGNGKVSVSELGEKQQKLREDVAGMEHAVSQLQQDFNTFLSNRQSV